LATSVLVAFGTRPTLQSLDAGDIRDSAYIDPCFSADAARVWLGGPADAMGSLLNYGIAVDT